MADRGLYPWYSFGSEEHPPSAKFNNILQILEQTRIQFGPFSITPLSAIITGAAYQPQISSFHLKLEDDPRQVGFISSADSTTERSFRVIYISGSSNYPYAAWSNLTFTSGTIENNTVWYMAITGGGASAPSWKYSSVANPISLRNATAANFIVYKESGGVA